jgi:hypothetical protein
LKLVMTAGEPLPPDKRSAFLERVAGYLQQTGYRQVRDVDVESAVLKSLKGLLHAPAA